MGLCPACQRIFTANVAGRVISSPRADFLQPVPHLNSLLEFQAGVAKNCFICAALHRNATNNYDEPQERHEKLKYNGTFSYFILTGLPSGVPAVHVHTTAHYDDPPYNVATYRLYSSLKFPSVDRLTPSTAPYHTGDVIRSWHMRCTTTHGACNRYRLGDKSPTRLIDIGNNSSRSWKLCIPKEDGNIVRTYTTMSYRWGLDPFLKLTSESFNNFRSGMEIAQLPQAFQDAILITRALGVQYIWIDALCIIQDLEQDCHKEFVQMANVYANTSCNIVATFGDNPKISLFNDRKQELDHVARVEPEWVGEPIMCREYDWKRVDSIVDTYVVSKELQSCVLASRGWIFQELLLAPCALYFGRDQVYWRCREWKASEMWPLGIPEGISVDLHFRVSAERLFDSRETNTNLWYSLIPQYTGLSLTKPEDRLNAIAGLAKLLQSRKYDDYFAGHWKNMLPWSLTWRAIHSTIEGVCSSSPVCHPHAPCYLAPSWSWAAANGRVEFKGGQSERHIFECEITNVQVTTVGDDPTARALNGHLILTAPSASTEVGEAGQLILATHHTISATNTVTWDHMAPTSGTKVKLAVILITLSIQDQSDMFSFHVVILEEINDNPICHRRLGHLYITACNNRGIREVLGYTKLDTTVSRVYQDEIPSNLDVFGLEILNPFSYNITVKDSAAIREFRFI